mgnify:CR=1 FL=1
MKTVRLASIKISNIKNVKDGQIIMPNTYKKRLSDKNAEILGIYGQNGSGKTAVIDTLYYLQKIMIGESLEDKLADYIDVSASEAEIITDFHLFGDNVVYDVTYRVFYCLWHLNLKKKKWE